MSAEPPLTYRIRLLQDFLDVPPERLTECLEEFRGVLAAVYYNRLVLGGVKALNDPEIEFDWTDDGKRELELRIEVGDRVLMLKTFDARAAKP